MTVREMTIDDLEQVMRIEELLFRPPWTREGFFSFLMQNNTLFLVAEEKGKILGYCGLQMAADEGDILNIGVAPERQNEGIGGFLMDSLLLLADQFGIGQIYLEVRKSNTKAIRLYTRKKFEQIGLRKDYYTEPVEDAILMAHYREGGAFRQS